MKSLKNIYFGLLSAGLLLLNACSLDEHIKDRPTPATITSEADVTAVIGGMYARFNDPGMFKFLGHIMLTICADDIYSTAGSEYGPYGQRTYTSGNTSPMWNNMYASIANANNLIEVLDKMELSPEFEKRAYGEAYFIRAFCYYYLVRLYGGVPLRLEATHVDSDFYLPRTTISETYAQIFSDFKAASERLPLQKDIKSGELGRASKGAAQALLAQAYLTYGNQLGLRGQDATEQYELAATYADSVIKSKEYQLLDNYGDLFDVGKEAQAYKEVIFGIRFQSDPTNRAQPAAGSEFAKRFGAGNTWGVSADGGNGSNTFRVSHWFADYYRQGDYAVGDTNSLKPDSIDYRNLKAFFQRGHNTNNGNYYAVYPNLPGTTSPGASSDGTILDPLVAKYQDPSGKDERNHGNDFFIIRYAEVLLIKAEALNELYGPTSGANGSLAPFNEVRERSRKGDGTGERPVPANVTTLTVSDKDAFRMKIFDERGLELVGEGQRWFDLVRMRSPLNPLQTMYEYQFFHRLNDEALYPREFPKYIKDTNEYTSKNAVYAPILNVSVPKYLLFPVPTTELIQNPNFGLQNTGW